MTASERGSTTDWLSVARSLASNVIGPRADEMDRSDRLPEQIRTQLGASGLMGLTAPTEFGGAQANTRVVASVLETLSVASAAVATILSVHLAVATGPVVDHGTIEQKRAWVPKLASGEWLGAFALTEPSVGSDAAKLATRYSRADGGFHLRGTKMFTTSAESADLIVLFATRDPQLGPHGISAFAIPKGTTGLSVGQRLNKLGIRGSETVELVLDDLALPESAMLGPEGQGFRIAMEALAGGRIGIAACALGVARAAFEQMRTAAAQDPADWKRTAVARAFGELSAASALVYRAADVKDQGLPFVEEASAAKLVASQAAMHIASTGLDVAGIAGARSGSPAERLLRDARVFPIVEGTTEIQELILGRSLVDRS